MKARSPSLFLFLMLAGVPLCAAELVEKIVARVNDRLITHSELEKRVSVAAQSPQAPTGSGELRRAVLDDMIREKLLEERAKELSVSATDEEIETAVEHVKRQYNLATDAEFDSALASANLTREQLRRQMKQTITLQKLIGREVTSKLDISDDMLRLEYERQKENLYKVPEQARVSEIVIWFAPADPAARKSAVERMEEARARIAEGTAFAEVARQYSQGNARERGGDLGLVSRGELLPPLDAAVFSDPPQEDSPPVLMPGSIHCFRIIERVPAGYRHFAEVSEDLKKRIGENLYDKRLVEYVEKLRHEAFIKIYDPELAKLLEKKT
ncbi:MAG: peptidylprolyl isomerase [Thermoanaerobaculia bacterium]